MQFAVRKMCLSKDFVLGCPPSSSSVCTPLYDEQENPSHLGISAPARISALRGVPAEGPQSGQGPWLGSGFVDVPLRWSTDPWISLPAEPEPELDILG